jgi:DNA mismatch repair protein MutS2
MHCYPKDTLDRFQFSEILALLESNCRSRTGKALALQLAPVSNRDLIALWLDQTFEYFTVLDEDKYFPPFAFPNIRKEVETLHVNGAVLEGAQFMNIRETVETANTVVRFLRQKREAFPALFSIVGDVEECKALIPMIDQILDPPGIVRSSASKALAAIRKSLVSQRQQASRLFMSEMKKCQKAGMLRDFNEGSYNNRRVLAVLAEYKRQVKGIIHGSSDTGRTTFIEPMSTVEINNELIELEQEEKKEIHRILKELTVAVRAFLPEIEAFEQILSELDLTQAKARLAITMNCARPRVSNKRYVEVHNAYHPLLLLQNKAENKTTIPLSLQLDEKNRIIVISGPNAGGKSIALKTLGLLQIMMQSGMMLPVGENTIMSVFERFFVDIGDDQSIEMELSTYSSRLVKMKHFLKFADKDTLLFIDEFGTGSDPELGGAIAEAILEGILEQQVFGIVTTHYSNIKILADKREGLTNACMLFNEQTLLPLYQLNIGQPGSSYTFEVAKKIGLPKSLLHKARQKLDVKKVKLDTLLVKLQKEQNEVQRQKETLQRELDITEEKAEMYAALRAQLEARETDDKASREKGTALLELGRRMKSLIELYDQKGDKKAVVKKLMIQLTSEKAKKDEARKAKKQAILKAETDEKAKEKARKATKRKAVDKALREEKIEVGTIVHLKDGKHKGEVESIDGQKVTVVFGMMKTIASKKDLRVAVLKKGKN